MQNPCSFFVFICALTLIIFPLLRPTFRMASSSHNEQIPASAPVIHELQRELNRLQRSIRLAIQSHLQRLEGHSFGSLEQNQSVVETVHSLLDGHGLRVQCSECGHPAILRVSPRRGITDGAFVFDHTIEGRRTFHGGRAVMPEIRLTAKPPRKKTTRAEKQVSNDGAKRSVSAKSVSSARKSAG